MSVVFNPFTGNLDFTGGGSQTKNFSYELIQTGEVVLIPQYQQMLMIGPLIVDGRLDVDGKVFIMEFT